jgi:hydrogenase expression/formation protein HypE
MHRLIAEVLAGSFGGPLLDTRQDAAVLPAATGRLAFTTDSYVVRPLFFPGGDIGALAVNGTVNDLAMRGARPLYLTAGFILEEGLPIDMLLRIAASMAQAAALAGVQIVAGDTKVVERGRGDGVYINTAGVGVIEREPPPGPERVQAGDAILLSGDLGRHGVAVMAAREDLSLECPLASDCAPLTPLVQALLHAGIEVHCLRDLTRGGLATALVEIAQASHLHLQIDERLIPVTEEVRGACEILGLDPVYVANEGRMTAFVPAAQAKDALQALRALQLGSSACMIGRVLEDESKLVTMISSIGSERIVDMLSGEQLPRIC